MLTEYREKPFRLRIKNKSTHFIKEGWFLKTGARSKAFIASAVSLLLVAGAVFPSTAKADVFQELVYKSIAVVEQLFATGSAEARQKPTQSYAPNLQTILLPRAVTNIDPASAKGGGSVIIDDSAVVPQEGPAGAGADVVYPKNSAISIYVVREGDTVSEIAQMFDVSVNTIMWANDITRSTALKVGQQLVILPISGVRHVVKKGDTLATVAKKYQADAEEIAQYNEIEGTLAVGMEITIPNGEIVVAAPARPTSTKSAASGASNTYSGYYLRPISGGTRTQGIHGYNGVDLAAPIGTPILASASGEVIVSRQGGWNGGYGNYVVIKHDNGTQTLYAHNSSNAVGTGQYVVKGQVIGYVGSTGRSTGAHVHFEIRGGPRNPF